MGRAPCCDKANVKKGPWSPEEDAKLKDYMEKHGTSGANWISLPTKAGLKRCGKSCRLRWLNYLRPNIKHGEFSEDEDRIIYCLFASIGSRWSIIASQLPGRTDNDIKNYWNTKLKKKLMLQNSTQPSLTQFQIVKNNNNSSNNSQYHPQYVSFTSHDSIVSCSPSLLSGNSSISSYSNIFQSQQEGNFMGTLQNYQVKDADVFMFNMVKESEIGDCGDAHSYLYGGVEEKQSGVFLGENELLDYGLEEIEELISTHGNCNNNFLFDENMTEERVKFSASPRGYI